MPKLQNRILYHKFKGINQPECDRGARVELPGSLPYAKGGKKVTIPRGCMVI